MPIHVGIKRREREPAELHRVPVLVLLNNDVGARFLVFQFNFIAHELDVLALRRIRGVAGNASRRTLVPFLPRIISTTLSKRTSRTSTNSPWPWPTAVIRSPTFNRPSTCAGPPG